MEIRNDHAFPLPSPACAIFLIFPFTYAMYLCYKREEYVPAVYDDPTQVNGKWGALLPDGAYTVHPHTFVKKQKSILGKRIFSPPIGDNRLSIEG